MELFEIWFLLYYNGGKIFFVGFLKTINDLYLNAYLNNLLPFYVFRLFYLA